MKQVFLFLLLTLCVNLFTNAQDAPAAELPKFEPGKDSAIIVIYRGGQFAGAAANWAMFLNGTKMCKLSNNKYMYLKVAPGKHTISSKIGGVEVFKKETTIDIDATAGNTYYIACTIKQSIMRARLELTEVTKSTADKQMAKLSLDNCQAGIDDKEQPAQ
jgi:hypothetical protein